MPEEWTIDKLRVYPNRALKYIQELEAERDSHTQVGKYCGVPVSIRKTEGMDDFIFAVTKADLIAWLKSVSSRRRYDYWTT